MQDGPGEAVVLALNQDRETPEQVWNQSMAHHSALEISNLANVARSSQVRSYTPVVVLRLAFY